MLKRLSLPRALLPFSDAIWPHSVPLRQGFLVPPLQALLPTGASRGLFLLRSRLRISQPSFLRLLWPPFINLPHPIRNPFIGPARVFSWYSGSHVHDQGGGGGGERPHLLLSGSLAPLSVPSFPEGPQLRGELHFASLGLTARTFQSILAACAHKPGSGSKGREDQLVLGSVPEHRREGVLLWLLGWSWQGVSRGKQHLRRTCK